MHRPPSPSPAFSHALPRAVLAGTAALLCMLAGCSQEDSTSDNATTANSAAAPAPTTSATLRRGDLMPLVFPGWEDRDTGRNGTVKLPDIGSDGQPVSGSEAEQKADLTPREVVRLDDTHAVMLTEAVPLDGNGEPITSHVSGAWLGAYFFEQGMDGWTLTKRTDAVDYLGFMGNIGQTRVERIAPQRFVLAATSGSCWQGNCGSWLSVYELDANAVSELVTSVPLSAENAGADEACDALLKNERPDNPPRGDCFDVNGTPEFTFGTDDEPGEMRIVFSRSRVANGANARLETIDSTTVYAYRKGTYVLSEGRNPVPSF